MKSCLQTDVNRIEVHYATSRDADPAGLADVDDMDIKIRLVMGQNRAIEWIKVDQVPRTPQGKMLIREAS